MSAAAVSSDVAIPASRSDSLFSRSHLAVTFGIVASVLLTAFEALAVGTAMPVAVADVHGVAFYSLASTAFATTSLFGMVLSGVRSDARGPRLPFLGGTAVFGTGLLLAGTAHGMAQLVAGRAVQGFGGGMVIVALYVVVGRAYPDDLRAKAFALMAALWVLPSVVGPLVAGTLTEHVSWRWVFLGVAAFVPLPLIALVRPLSRMTNATAAAGMAGVADGEAETEPGNPGAAAAAGRIRLRAAALAALGVGFLQFAEQDLTWIALPLLAAAVALLVPSIPKLLPGCTFRASRGLPTVILLRGILAGAYFGAEYYIPLMLVEERRVSPTVSGLTLVGTTFSWAFAAAAANRGWIRTSREAMVRIGAVVTIASISLTGSAVLLPAPAAVVTVAMVVGGFGMGLVFPTLSLLTLRLSAPEEQGVNSSSLQIADGFGNVLLTGLVGAAFHVFHGTDGTNGTLYVAMFGTFAAAAVAATALSTRISPASQT